MPNQRTVFTCPECDHEDEYLNFEQDTRGTETGSYCVANDDHDYGDHEYDAHGDRTYACVECGHHFDHDELQRHISRPPEEGVTGLTVAENSSAEENQGPDNVRVMDLKDDATGEAITETQTCECHKCRTLISTNGKNKFVVCINPKCGFEFDKTARSPLTLIPALQ